MHCVSCGNQIDTVEAHKVDGSVFCDACLHDPAVDVHQEQRERERLLAEDWKEEADETQCQQCGEAMIPEQCWHCHGAGGFHDCGEDCCCCRDPDGDLNEPCLECDEQGEYLVCPNAGKQGHGAEDG